MLPAAAQGVIGIECRDDRTELLQVLRLLDHEMTKTTTIAERAVAARLNADCQSPLATFAEVTGSSLRLQGLVASADGRTVIREQLSGTVDEAESLGIGLADRLFDMGAGELLARSGTDE